MLLAAMLPVACRQATPAEVGIATTRNAHPAATMAASKRAAEVSPSAVSPAAAGAALQQPPAKL